MAWPRVALAVTGHAGGWTVRPHEWLTDRPLVPPFEMEAVEVILDGFAVRVPAVPAVRRPEPAGGAGSHAALCAGDRVAVTHLLDRINARSPEPGDATVYGRWLFECLLAPAWEAIRGLSTVRSDQPRPGVEIALQWPASDSDLHRLLWEAMHDGFAPLAGHPELTVAMTRIIDADVQAPPPVTRLPHVLYAVGSALTDDVIRPGAMFVGLLRGLEADGACLTRIDQQVTVDELKSQCARFSPDLVHIVAHGSIDSDGEGVLELRGESGGQLVTANELFDALTAGEHPPAAVVVSACRSGSTDGPPGSRPMAAKLVARGIPIVSAMAGEIGEQACRLYTRGLAKAIHAGRPVVDGAADGRRAALLRAERSDTYLDWAMPALFMSSRVPPGYRVIDPSGTQNLLKLAGALELRQEPVFIGRESILKLSDDLIDSAAVKPVGFVAIHREGPLTDLGGTRLLREIAYRFLCAGHVPLFLGPYGPTDALRPRDLRSVVVAVLERANDFTEFIGRALPSVTAMLADPDFDASAVSAQSLSGSTPDEARDMIQDTLLDFGRRTEALEPKRVHRRLAADLRELAVLAEATGGPFGKHTRVVVLCDDVHDWIGAVEPFLAMCGPSGLGTLNRPVPVVVTASFAQGGGAAVRAFQEQHSGAGFSYPSLDELDPVEAAIGFQWVLLHPWMQKFPEVYTAANGQTTADMVSLFGILEGKPTEVSRGLYLVAHGGRGVRFNAADDEGALREYASRYP